MPGSSLRITLPSLPKKPEDLEKWAAGLHRALHYVTTIISRHINELVIEGPVASMPAATGSKGFYYATDTAKLYYDGGTWVILN